MGLARLSHGKGQDYVGLGDVLEEYMAASGWRLQPEDFIGDHDSNEG